jgi:hypothetical protein
LYRILVVLEPLTSVTTTVTNVSEAIQELHVSAGGNVLVFKRRLALLILSRYKGKAEKVGEYIAAA